jgi:hypothetical protein
MSVDCISDYCKYHKAGMCTIEMSHPCPARNPVPDEAVHPLGRLVMISLEDAQWLR